jgi:hypothetical protein
MERWLIHERRTRQRKRPKRGNQMFSSIAAFFRGLFGRKEDNFKSLLIADLGIER